LKLLLDTHYLLWVLAGDKRAKALAHRLQSADHLVHFSVVSIWEIALKASQGKLPINAALLRQEAIASGLREITVLGPHAVAIGKLPWHHRDPFDRMLVAQAATEPMRLITNDALLAAYGDCVEVV
jgi:PIN domain nuclease of toxin-antitoxin system